MSSFNNKVAFFQQLDALENPIEDDNLPDEEIEHRAKCRAFSAAFKNASKTPEKSHPAASPQQTQSPTPATAHPKVVDLTSDEPTIIPCTASPKPRGLSGTSQSPIVIDNTPSVPERRPDLLRTAFERAAVDATADSPLSVIEDTPIPDTTKPDPQNFSKVRTLLGEASPSVSMLKKRKRGSEPKLVPEADRIFKDLRFYYIPNNDIHPVRKARINKAREYGVTWVKGAISEATHVIVDKNLEYKDIERLLGPEKDHARRIVVNEDYPIDCIQFKNVLKADQLKYRVRGYPESITQVAVTIENSTTNPQGSSGIQDSDGVIHSDKELPRPVPTLQRHTTAPIPPTIKSQDAGPSRAIESSPIASPLRPSSPVQPPAAGPKDELSDYINMMQAYKGLPLDKDDDEDDCKSALGGTDGDFDSDDSISEGERDLKRRKARASKSRGATTRRKEISWEDRFACNQGGTKDSNAVSKNPNKRTIDILQAMCDYYERINDHWRILAYRKAINTLKRQNHLVKTAEEAFMLPNIGQRLADKIEEITMTNRLRKLEYAVQDPTDQSLQLFLGVYGAGTSTAQGWISQGFRTLEDLLSKAKLSTNQRLGVERYNDLNTRIPRREVEALSEYVMSVSREIDPAVDMVVGGSYRRGAESSGDVDFIITKKGTTSSADLVRFLERLLDRLEDEGVAVATLAALGSDRPSKDGPGSKWHGCCVLPEHVSNALNPHPAQSTVPLPPKTASNYNPIWRRVDFLLVPETEFGAALVYFTGNDIFNRSMRLLASRKGMRLNQRGLYREVMRGGNRMKITEGELVEGRSEKRIFELLGVTWREPWERWC